MLLYELLTGHTPFDARGTARRRPGRDAADHPGSRSRRALDPAQHAGRGDQTTVAQRRQSEPPQLIHLVRGDLDWIVMRCLEKDRTRRYETANSLAEDILRHLNNEPVDGPAAEPGATGSASWSSATRRSSPRRGW